MEEAKSTSYVGVSPRKFPRGFKILAHSLQTLCQVSADEGAEKTLQDDFHFKVKTFELQ